MKKIYVLIPKCVVVSKPGALTHYLTIAATAIFQWKNDENYPFFTSQLVELYTILLARREKLTLLKLPKRKMEEAAAAVP